MRHPLTDRRVQLCRVASDKQKIFLKITYSRLSLVYCFSHISFHSIFSLSFKKRPSVNRDENNKILSRPLKFGLLSLDLVAAAVAV